jgi:hypothetical protein
MAAKSIPSGTKRGLILDAINLDRTMSSVKKNRADGQGIEFRRHTMSFFLLVWCGVQSLSSE